MRRATGLAVLLLWSATAFAAEPAQWVGLPGSRFRSVLALEDKPQGEHIPGFGLMRTPVTNAQFLEFLRAQPRWRRDRVPAALAEPRYLSHWAGALELGPDARPEQPVVWVSWFAADAYCRAQGARLPMFSEWEYAAAADGSRFDARSDPAWRERILAWYSVPSSAALSAVGQSAANAYGVQDLHGLVWEWVEDYSALLVSGDNRNQGVADQLEFCGAGALAMSDRENYAILMRVAMLSSLEGAHATANLGFRCARGP